MSEQHSPPSDQPKFIADCNVGKLAKWLRILGYDVLYDPQMDDQEIVRRALAENRVILTRDNGIIQRKVVNRYVLITSDDVAQQVHQVLRTFHLNLQEAPLLSRCAECNSLLVPIAREEVRSRVPPKVFEFYKEFASCPACNRIYWHGSHIDRVFRRLGITDDSLHPSDEVDSS